MSEDKTITDIIEKATLLFHGENIAASATTSSKDKCRHLDMKSADTLLTNAEQMLCTTTQSSYSESPLPTKNDGGVNFLRNVRDAAVLRCQIAGKKRDFNLVLQAAKTAIDAIENLPADENDAFITAAVLGYQGFALMKLQRFEDAIIPLEHSVEQQKRSITKNTTNAFAEKRARRERAAVQSALQECYILTGTDPPIPDLVKFPRTSHLFDAGGTATTSDDIVLSCDDAMFQQLSDKTTQVIIEEKVDGSNVGFLLCPISGRILAQNRSHYISSGEHAQFSQITEWIALHRLALLDILSGSTAALKHDDNGHDTKIGPFQIENRGRFILYGEWVVARHSIPYQKLPGYFIAFDLYDKHVNKFYSRERFHNIMKGSGIPVTPVIKVCNFASDVSALRSIHGKRQVEFIQTELRALLDTPSEFRNDGGTVEGIVLRIDDDSNTHTSSQWLLHKSKIVRPDFIRGCADGHWATRSVEKQRIDYKFAAEYIERCYGLASSSDGEVEKKHSACEDRSDFDRKICAGGRSGSPKCGIAAADMTRTESGEVPASQDNSITSCSDVAYGTSISPKCSDKETEKQASEKSHEKCDGKLEKRNARKMRDIQTERTRLRRRAPRIIMLCGLPGAGKSTFAARLNHQSLESESIKAPTTATAKSSSTASASPVQWTIVNQDILGRKECVALAGRACRNKGRVILDRCNMTASERKEWMDIVHNPSKGDAALVYVATTADTCVQRVQNRVHHQTIPHGKGERIVRQLEKQIEPPTQEERKELFGTVEVLLSGEEVEDLLKRWGA